MADSDSITIAGQPILVDWQCQLRGFLADRLPPEDILFSRLQMPIVQTNPFACDNAPDYVQSPYPQLPAIQIGELQWPSGASRYSRALYAVDWPSLVAIAESAWGSELPTEPPDEVPSTWGSSFYEVPLVIRGELDPFEAPMYVLRPYRVPGSGCDCWLLPLVDARWKMAHKAYEPPEFKPEDMTALIDSIASACGTSITQSSHAITGPLDKRLWKAEQPAAHLLDVACLSAGLRVVRDPGGTMRAIGSAASESRRVINQFEEWMILSGGKVGETILPSSVRVHCRQEDGDKFVVKTAAVSGGSGPGGTSLAVWSSWMSKPGNVSATNAFATQIADLVTAWGLCGGQYGMVGAKPYLPAGHDDFMSILLEEKPSGEVYTFRMAVRELPGVFLPRAILMGGEDDDCCKSEDHFLFTLSSDMYSGGGDAAIRSMDDLTLVESSVNVANTLGHFSKLKSGDRGICVKVKDVYYAVHPEGVGEAGGVIFTLDSNLAGTVAATATATVVVSGIGTVPVSSSITVYNTGRKKSWIGALGWAVKIGEQFWVTEIDQYPLRSWVKLNADTHTFSAYFTRQGKVADQRSGGVGISSWNPMSPYPFSFLPEEWPTILNSYNLIGLADDIGIVEWDDTAEQFELVEMLPWEKRRLQFRLTADMPTVMIPNTGSFEIIQTREFTAGEVTAPDYIYDPMRLIVNGKSGDVGECVYSYREESWQVVAFRRREFGAIEGEIQSVTTKSSGPYVGLKAALVMVKVAPPDRSDLLGVTVEVIDHSGCIFDLDEEDLIYVWCWAGEQIADSLADGPSELTPVHWSVKDRCCTDSETGG